ncbi:MAG: Maf family protein [Caldiserica bacterium]|jgi:septum formation protein|nr:Maf family protein [Caldisericota bacterium]MDH7562483.1 Maf family protein [Caldisericota bacterium]
MKKLFLASSSPRRRSLIKLLGWDFSIIPSRVKEEILPGELPEVACQRLALDKAIKGASQVKSGIVLGCDTIVVLDSEFLGKPKDPDEAFSMLKKLSGKKHRVLTGLALLDTETSQILTDFEETLVYFRELEDREIENYVKSGEPLGKAGAYAIQGKAAVFVERIEGCFYNVVGLPLYRLHMLLKKIGMKVE